MKRYLAFYGMNYYPCGGMDDFIGDFDSLEACKNAIISRYNSVDRLDRGTRQDNWHQIWDTKENKEVIFKIPEKAIKQHWSEWYKETIAKKT